MTDSLRRQRKHFALLILLAVGMFGFAFALVPLYNVFCEITGLNGKTSGRVAFAEEQAVDSDRTVTVEFLAHVSTGMPWEFRPIAKKLKVHPGELYTAKFYARNRASQTVIGQAVPSVTPGQAASHLHKTECFCFTQQHLSAGEHVEMPVSFYVDPELPDNINTLSLSYTLFKVGVDANAGDAGERL